MKFPIFILILICVSLAHCEQQHKEEPIEQPKQLTSEPQVNNNSQKVTANQNCLQRIWENSFIGGLIGGGTAGTVSLASGAAISSAGFTGGGVAAGSIAAGTQSAIGLVGAGSNFAYFQSLGALGQGIFGAYALPVVIGAVVIGGGAYVAYECFSE